MRINSFIMKQIYIQSAMHLSSSHSARRRKTSGAKNSLDRPETAPSGMLNPYMTIPSISEQRKANFKILNSQNTDGIINKRGGTSIKKEKEELYEENIALKKEVHKLSEELTALKGKVEACRIRNDRRTNYLELEFEKELYWTGNKTHVISGIKHQYQKLKREHSVKCEELATLKRERTKTGVPELMAYQSALETENLRLKNKISALETDEMKEQVREDFKEQHLLENTQEQFQKLQKSHQQQEKKIEFLQRLLKEQKTKEFQANQKVRRVEKQREVISKEKTELQQEFNSYKENLDAKMREKEKESAADLEHCQVGHQQELAQKEKTIDSLENRIKSLEESLRNMQVINTPITPNQYGRETLAVPGGFTEYLKQMKALEESSSVIAEEKSERSELGERTMKTAERKHSENSKRSRKVGFSEVESIAEFLKFKMINSSIDDQAVKAYFDAKGDAEGEEGWWQEHITMKETLEILELEPFGLKADSASLLARYLVEDAEGEYVYCDLANEQKREVVKSIVRSLLGEYELAAEGALAQYEQLMKRYSTNIGSALRTVCPSGLVSSRKFLELLDGLGIEASREAREWAIAKLVAHSHNLSELNYKMIFIE